MGVLAGHTDDFIASGSYATVQVIVESTKMRSQDVYLNTDVMSHERDVTESSDRTKCATDGHERPLG